MADAVTTWVALLRGVNVGGKNRLPMIDLRTLLEDLGCRQVRTLIQSGNAVFAAAADRGELLPGQIADGLAERFGFAVPVVLRSAAELTAVLARNPFIAAGRDPATLHVAFLAVRPCAAAVAALDPDRSPPDEFRIDGREVFLHLPNGVARSKLTNAWLERGLGTTSTVRNWTTVGALAAIAGKD